MPLKIGRRTAKAMKSSRPSQTTGRSKGIRPSALQKSMCRRNRSWKDPLYGLVMKSLGDGINRPANKKKS
jgi:hypothetical protein